MRTALLTMLALAALAIAGCVNVDLGQASKDWSEVGESFADAYKEGQQPPAGGQMPQATP
ncbi:MAG: hypothetical protein P8123_00125 [bacterium]